MIKALLGLLFIICVPLVYGQYKEFMEDNYYNNNQDETS